MQQFADSFIVHYEPDEIPTTEQIGDQDAAEAGGNHLLHKKVLWLQMKQHHHPRMQCKHHIQILSHLPAMLQ